MYKTGDRLPNGTQCLLSGLNDRGDEIVLAMAVGFAQPWVTWLVSDEGTIWGHYFSDLNAALIDYEARLAP